MYVPLLIVGGGPGAYAAAEAASSWSLRSLVVVGERCTTTFDVGEVCVSLDDQTVSALHRHGMLDVLRPHLNGASPPTLTSSGFERVFRQHCVADVNVELYDGVTIEELATADGDPPGVSGFVAYGSARWNLEADAMIDTSAYPSHLGALIMCAIADVQSVLQRLATDPSGR